MDFSLWGPLAACTGALAAAGGVGAAWAAARLRPRLAAAAQSLAARDRELAQAQADLRLQQAQGAAREQQAAALAQQAEAFQQQAQKTLADRFTALSEQVLAKKAEDFDRAHQSGVRLLLAPVEGELKRFRERIEQVWREEVHDRASFSQLIGDMRSDTARLGEDARQLSRALMGDNKHQGDWGEMVLERLLEAAGLAPPRDFEVQRSAMVGERRLRPDVVINLPGDRQVVVDAKVSLTDYYARVHAADDESRARATRAHLDSMRRHIRELGGKNYQAIYAGVHHLDCVMMFVPIEPAFLCALEADGRLWQMAWERNVLLVGPTTLLYALRIVAHLWRQQQQTDNVREVMRRGGLLVDKLAGVHEAWQQVGRGLADAQRHFDEAEGRLARGKGNLISQVHKLCELGVRPKHRLPKEVLRAAGASALPQGEDAGGEAPGGVDPPHGADEG